MASLASRVSGLWEANVTRDTMGDDIEQRERDERTPLDKTIDRIGMGSYQWALLALCGFGWMADNMWIQTIAIILPRVQRHFSIPDNYIGYLSTSMFAGMMFGAVGWGSCSDILGRSKAFNLTLFFTAVFGLLASTATTFFWLCVTLFFLGTSVGGSMPTDGTLLLEHMPQNKLYMVTALSVFFSFGAVISALMGILVIPGHSCLQSSPVCDVAKDNIGWKYLLMAVGLITLSMFLGRIAFFRLHESPRYLVHAGRPEEALLSLQKISRFNGSELTLDLNDVCDRPVIVIPTEDEAHVRTPFLDSTIRTARLDARVVFDADVDVRESEVPGSGNGTPQGGSPERTHYDSTGLSTTQLEGHSFRSPTDEYPRNSNSNFNRISSDSSSPAEVKPEISSGQTVRLRQERQIASSSSRRSSLYEAQARLCWSLPRWIRKPLWAWLDKLALVFAPEWLQITLLVWAMWCLMSLAYTMFNVFLPKLLEMRQNRLVLITEDQSLQDTMWDVVIFTLGGCPGAILGAYLVESSLGRKLSLASSTFVTALFCVAFTFAESSLAVRLSTIGISLSSTTMWAVLYGWTPEIFGTEVRGTACGAASALSRIGGMIAPLVGGALLVIDRSIPVYTSVVIFALAGVCVLLLNVDGSKASNERLLIH